MTKKKSEESTQNFIQASVGKVVLELLPPPEKKAGALILPDEKPPRYCEAKILSVGTVDSQFDAGDIVLIDRYGGHHAPFQGIEYIIMKEEEILATIVPNQD